MQKFQAVIMGYVRMKQVRAHLLTMLIVLSAFTSAALPEARGEGVCEGKPEEPGGTSPFFGIEHLFFQMALAEKACGAPPSSFPGMYMRALEGRGCGPDTYAHRLIKERFEPLDGLELKELAAWAQNDGVDTPRQVRDWTRENVEAYGGCPALLDFHQQFISKLRSTSGATSTE